MNNDNETENELSEVKNLTKEELDAAYQEQYGVNSPDFVVHLTQDGVLTALCDLLYKAEVVSPGTQIKGLIAPIDFTGVDGTLPVAVYLEGVETSALN